MSPLQGSTLGVIGAGVMAEAIIAGVLERKLVPASSVVASHPRADRRHALGEKYGIHVTADNAEAARRGDAVVLGIKPQVMPGVLKEIRESLAPEKLVISIIAGATTQTLRNGLDHAALVRVMPNTPAQIGEGVNIWYATPETTAAHREQAKALLGALGHELQVADERFVAMATAVSGTGPTYVFLVMEALIDSAVHLGFPRHMAHDLVLETIKGSVAFAERTQKQTPGAAARHGDIAGWDVSGRIARAGAWPAAHRPRRCRLGRLSPDDVALR
jgi:pyrroline-5-carboxylate reductase